jgi:hypothetical protein
LSKEVNLLGLLSIPLLVKSCKLEQKILAYLHERLGHIHFAFELWVHRQERCAVELLEGGYENHLDVFDGQEVKVPEVKLGGAPIDEELITNLLEVGLAVLEVCFGFWLVLAACLVLFVTCAFVKHVHIDIGSCTREVFCRLAFEADIGWLEEVGEFSVFLLLLHTLLSLGRHLLISFA